MGDNQTSGRCIIIFVLTLNIRFSPLLHAACESVKLLGFLSVEPGPLVLLGSDPIVYCHDTQQTCDWRSRLSLDLDGQRLEPEQILNCTTAKFRLNNFRRPRSILICKRRTADMTQNLCGMILRSGLKPDKPTEVHCETLPDSDTLDCSWNRGQETYLLTTYNVSLTRANGTQILGACFQGTNFTVTRTLLDEDGSFLLTVTALNHFGSAESEPFSFCIRDVATPETPRIVHVEFWKDATAAVLRWNSPESADPFKYYTRIRTRNGPWVSAGRSHLWEGLVQLEDLKPLTEYEFQIRSCFALQRSRRCTEPSSDFGFTPKPRSVSGQRPLCSRWSASERRISPGKCLHVWRTVGHRDSTGMQNVTVFWKPPSPEDYSGDLCRYEIVLDDGREQEVMFCPAAASQCSVQVSHQVKTLNVTAVTSFGRSPPACVDLRRSGVAGPTLTELVPAGNGDDVSVSWVWPMTDTGSAPAGELSGFVIEWKGLHAELHWQKVDNVQTYALITGLSASLRYNISLYAVTSSGVSDPSSGLVYTRDQKPLSGPNVSVLVREAGRILIQWEELPMEQQRGLISNYTVYRRTLDSSHREHRMTVSGPGQLWLDCPDQGFLLWMTASTSAGEGPQGNVLSLRPVEHPVGLVTASVSSMSLFMVIVGNLMCWSCVRKRIKTACVSLGPTVCLGENLPNLGNSKAIRMLKDHSDPDLFWSLSHSDSSLSQHFDHVEVVWAEPKEDPASQQADRGMDSSYRPVETVSYKPQLSKYTLGVEDEGEAEVAARDEDPRDISCGVLCGGDEYFSGTFLRLAGCSGGPSGPSAPQTSSLLCEGFLLGELAAEGEALGGAGSLGSQQTDAVAPDKGEGFLLQSLVQTPSPRGYFPQVAAGNGETWGKQDSETFTLKGHTLNY